MVKKCGNKEKMLDTGFLLCRTKKKRERLVRIESHLNEPCFGTKGGLMELRKVSTHFSLRSPRRLT